ncbi:hypothetical protein J8273_1255 [Carpediemonas membranifera]|uniref:Poly(A) RNA polymerase mitochondrial-like central palm domain-containing protein n=1 Tax=Carpediemonas membranifera TaxID=201153 RepID=A0A8J6B1M3_9EUKA|nr:hypothetical protein J8273_1255 [Carpediemonas membranifera]|eukprot:KAG9397340.1 hypothetical protein J8273_1255 [Carpediemonas membranifera]
MNLGAKQLISPAKLRQNKPIYRKYVSTRLLRHLAMKVDEERAKNITRLQKAEDAFRSFMPSCKIVVQGSYYAQYATADSDLDLVLLDDTELPVLMQQMQAQLGPTTTAKEIRFVNARTPLVTLIIEDVLVQISAAQPHALSNTKRLTRMLSSAPQVAFPTLCILKHVLGCISLNIPSWAASLTMIRMFEGGTLPDVSDPVEMLSSILEQLIAKPSILFGHGATRQSTGQIHDLEYEGETKVIGPTIKIGDLLDVLEFVDEELHSAAEAVPAEDPPTAVLQTIEDVLLTTTASTATIVGPHGYGLAFTGDTVEIDSEMPQCADIQACVREVVAGLKTAFRVDPVVDGTLIMINVSGNIFQLNLDPLTCRWQWTNWIYRTLQLNTDEFRAAVLKFMSAFVDVISPAFPTEAAALLAMLVLRVDNVIGGISNQPTSAKPKDDYFVDMRDVFDRMVDRVVSNGGQSFWYVETPDKLTQYKLYRWQLREVIGRMKRM